MVVNVNWPPVVLFSHKLLTFLDANGHSLGYSNWCTVVYNGTYKPWYAIVSDEDGPSSCWTSVYVSANSGATYISYCKSVRDSSDTLLAVSGVDYIVGTRLSKLNQ